MGSIAAGGNCSLRPHLRLDCGLTCKGGCDRWAAAAWVRGRIGGRGAGPLTVGPPEAPPPDGLLGDVGDADVLTELSVFALQEVRQVVHLQSKFRFNQVSCSDVWIKP